MRIVLIDYYVKELVHSLGEPRDPVVEEGLRARFQVKDYSGMMRLIKTRVGPLLPIKLGMVNSGGPKDAQMWTQVPAPIAPYGTEAFTTSHMSLFVRRSFTEVAPFEMLVVGLSNALITIVLKSVGSALADDPSAVDVAALLFGYTNFYRNSKPYTAGVAPSMVKGLFWARQFSAVHLSEPEIEYAASLLSHYATGTRSQSARSADN
jgi:hypothetical protein